MRKSRLPIVLLALLCAGAGCKKSGPALDQGLAALSSECIGEPLRKQIAGRRREQREAEHGRRDALGRRALAPPSKSSEEPEAGASEDQGAGQQRQHHTQHLERMGREVEEAPGAPRIGQGGRVFPQHGAGRAQEPRHGPNKRQQHQRRHRARAARHDSRRVRDRDQRRPLAKP